MIFFTYITLGNYDYKKYGKEIFERYFDFEVWNLHKFFWGESIPEIRSDCDIENIIEIKNVVEFINCLQRYNPKKTFLFFLFPPNQKKTYYLETIVSMMRFEYSMAFCQPYLSICNIGKLRDDISRQKKDYVNAILNCFYPPTFNFVAAPASFREFPSAISIKKQNNIMIHTLDYDVYLDIKDEDERLIKDKYIVFVDESYVAHVDYQIFGVESPFKDPENYYKPMCKFFDLIEDIYGYRIIVAEHPRAHYPDNKVYGNREMIKGQTARLIKDAEMVLCHTSTALDYIILFKKKFLLIYLDEIMKFYEWDAYYIPLLKYLKIKALNVSKDYDREKIEKMISSGASATCRKYKQQFIKQKGTKEEPFFEIVAENILNCFKRNEGL